MPSLIAQIKSKLYPDHQRHVWGQGERPIAEWLKEAGYNLVKVRAARIFHMDMNVTREYAVQLIRQNFNQLKDLR